MTSPPACVAISAARQSHRIALQRFARDLAVVERETSGADGLAGLVALARDHDDVARSGLARSPRRIARRRSSFDDRPTVGGDAARGLRPRSPSGSSDRGLSEVRIRTVGEPSRGRAHQRPLGAVPITAAAVHDRDRCRSAPASVPRRREHALERVGRVRVVDEDGEVAARRRPRSNRPGTRMRCPRPATTASHGRPPARAVAAAASRFATLKSPSSVVDSIATSRVVATRHERERGAVGRALDVRAREVGRSVVDRERPHVDPAAVRTVEQRRPRGSSTARSRPCRENVTVEQPRLRLEVGVHRAVVVEVVVREVREAHRREARRRRRGAARARATTPPSRRCRRPRRACARATPAARSPPASCAPGASTVSPMAVPSVPMRPARSPLRDARWPRARSVTVVLPFVPVTPSTRSRMRRVAVEPRSRRGPSARAHRRDPRLRDTSTVDISLDEEPDRAARRLRPPRRRARR